MNRKLQFAAAMLLLAAVTRGAGNKPVSLVPKLRPGQQLTYLIQYRSDKNVNTESRVAAPMLPHASQINARGLLQIEVLDLQQSVSKLAMHARGRFLTLDSGVWLKNPGNKEPPGNVQRIPSDDKTFEFTISPDGFAEKVTGLDAFLPDQQQAWQEWLARFAAAWTLPAGGVKPGEKWKSERPEPAGAPIAALHWLHDSVYVRNEPCQAKQVSVRGELSSSDGPPDICAVLLTTAALKQKSSPKDATPEDFKLHELKTMGTAKGTNEIITYISLKTGLVVRATEEASQQMDLVVAKADGSNRVHYNVDAKSHSEVLLITGTPLNRP